jgi:hypothetical protein
MQFLGTEKIRKLNAEYAEKRREKTERHDRRLVFEKSSYTPKVDLP